MVKWVERTGSGGWGARSASQPLASMPSAGSVLGVKVHYTGGAENANMATDHTLCDNRVRSVQNGHMDGNGWSDIGYSFVVCMHGYAFVGRGFGKLPAANGAGLNSGHYAILGLVGTSGVVTPSDAMKSGIRDVIEWLRAKGIGNQIKGHRDGYATDCPGSKLYAWVKAGAPRPAGTTPPPTPPVTPPVTPPTTPTEVPMDYTSLGLTGGPSPVVPANVPTDVAFDHEFADPTHGHVDTGANPSFLDGPAKYSVDVELVLSGVIAGDRVLTRVVEVKAGTSPGEVLEYTQWRPTEVLPDGDGTVVINHQSIGAVQEGRKARFQVQHNGAGTVRVAKAWLRMTSQES
jgi:hypothetical protein